MPLAPGYQIQKETLTVHFVPGPSPHLGVSAQYRLANVGNVPLHFIGVELPGKEGFGSAHLQAEIGGKPIALEHNPAEVADDWRIPMPVPWRQKEKLSLVLSYDLAAEPVGDPRIFTAATAFYLNDSGWFPTLEGFKQFLSPAVVRPNPSDLIVLVPADFRVTASGQLRGTTKQNGEVQYRFRIRKADFDPYVLAGQYNEQRVSGSEGAIVLWTFKPTSAAEAEQTAAQIAAARKVYEQTFARLPADLKSIYDVDAPQSPSLGAKAREGSLPPGMVENGTFRSSAPGGTVTEGTVLGPGGPTELAGTWFGHVIRPTPEAWMLAQALAGYAATTLDRSGAASSSGVTVANLENYNRARAESVEKSILSLVPSDPEDQLRLGGYKMALFFAALEDQCGAENVRRAISDMVYALRGQQYGYADFRAALEARCHEPLGDFFRSWLVQPGIPPAFRARYRNARGR